jgi:hypothetical protein
MSRLVDKLNQRVRQPFMFHYPCLLSPLLLKYVEKRRTAHRVVESC